MDTKERFTLQEIEQLCRAYMDCRLTRLQEKELELILLYCDLTSPIIAEVRVLMGLSTLMAVVKPKAIKSAKLRVLKYISFAACIASVIVCVWIFFNNTDTIDETHGIYACVDGEILSGCVAQTIVNEVEKESMNMFRSIVEDVEEEQRFSEQYMNDIIKCLP